MEILEENRDVIIKDISSKFNHIVNGAFHIAHYHPRYLGQDDEVSNLLLKFKDNIDPWVTRWANHAASELSGLNNINIIVRVLSSNEKEVKNPISLDKLGEALDITLPNSKYLPTALTKSRSTKPLKTLKTKKEREAELSGVYSFQLPKGISASSDFTVLVIDDIITSGTTLKEVARAISAVYPIIKIVFFALGQTYDSWAGGPSGNEDVLRLLKRDKKLQKKKTRLSVLKKVVKRSHKIEGLLQSVTKLINDGFSIIEILDKTNCSKKELSELVKKIKENNFIDNDIHIPPAPHLIFDYTQMGWQPIKGYKWKDKSNPKNFKVILTAPGPNLIPSSKTPGKWIPNEGYKWANPDNTNDISVIKRK